MNIQPLDDRILVEVLKAKEKTKEGIILPDVAQNKPQEAKVIAIGKVSQIEVDDIVLFGKYTGAEITVDDKKYLILKIEDVLAIIK